MKKGTSILDQMRAPLFEALLAYTQQVQGNFHVPGHKQGNAFDPLGQEVFAPMLELDMTEVADLDDLHDPSGVIAEAQALAADAFGAEQTLFLVGGTTAGNLASFLALCESGDEIILQRNSHQSLFHGCLLSGAKPIYIGAEVDDVTGFEQPLEPRVIQQLLKEKPEIKGVWITSPSYFGVNQPVKEIVEVCHQFDTPLIVDEAHGAHYAFHPALPSAAIQLGADLVIQSTHKMLSSMTMSSMLHMQGKRVQPSRLLHWLRVIESSSPSYPLMASLDLARRDAYLHGKKRMGHVLKRLARLRIQIGSLQRLKECQLEPDQDPFKLTLIDRSGGTGRELAALLAQRGIFVELADTHRILLIFSVGTTEQDCTKLWEALQAVDRMNLSMKAQPTPRFAPVAERVSQAIYSFAELKRAKRIRIPLKEAIGKVALEMITPYPPGIPVVLPGERITETRAAELSVFLELDGNVRGISKDGKQQVIVME